MAATVHGVSREAYYPWLRHGSGSWLISGIQAEIEARELQAELAAAEMRANAQPTTSVASSSAVSAEEEITELRAQLDAAVRAREKLEADLAMQRQAIMCALGAASSTFDATSSQETSVF